jgi:ABC-type sugar transport system substrate-binding protein
MTYVNENWTEYITSNALEVRGTWYCDLDYPNMKEVDDETLADFKNERLTNTDTKLTSKNGAKFMKRTMKKMLSFGLVAAMSLTMLAGCGNSKDATNDTNVSNGQEEKKPTGDVKIGVLVQDVSGEEELGFRSYYENYIADQYGVTFTYTDELKDAASEKSAIEKFASQGYQAVISFSSNDRALQIETCEENKIYYAVAAGTLDQEQFEKYKTDEYFLGQVGPSMDTEYEAGVEMGKFFADKGIKTAAIYGAFIPNPMHVYRTAGVLAGLGLSYGGATTEEDVVGLIFADQGIDLSKISGDIKIVSYLQVYFENNRRNYES